MDVVAFSRMNRWHMKLSSYLITIGAAAFVYVANPCLSYADDDKGPDKTVNQNTPGQEKEAPQKGQGRRQEGRR